MIINSREAAEKIIDCWNNGDKDEARRLFFMSQMLLPQKTKDFFSRKLEIKQALSQKQFTFLKSACDVLGGKIIHNGMVIYENR